MTRHRKVLAVRNRFFLEECNRMAPSRIDQAIEYDLETTVMIRGILKALLVGWVAKKFGGGGRRRGSMPRRY